MYNSFKKQVLKLEVKVSKTRHMTEKLFEAYIEQPKNMIQKRLQTLRMRKFPETAKNYTLKLFRA